MSRLGDFGAKLHHGEASYDIVGKRRWWFSFSALLILISIGSVAIFGLKLGIEFRGGVDYTVSTPVTSSTVQDFQQAVADTDVAGLGDPQVTTVGNTTVQVEIKSVDQASITKVRDAIAKQAGVAAANVSYNQIGPSWGGQITQKAIIALIVFLVLVGVVIWAYFRETKMAVAALVALAHDLIITIGIYALVRFDVTPETVIGVLTILGYSLYDTVVVFDKVRENTRGVTGSSTRTYSGAANLAVNQTLARSINTSLIALLPVIAILVVGINVLGTGPLKDLSLALLVGIAIGAYSSIFVATPLLAMLKEREPGMQALRRRVEQRQSSGDIDGSARREARRRRAAARTSAAGSDAEPVGAGGTATAVAERDDDSVAADEATEATSASGDRSYRFGGSAAIGDSTAATDGADGGSRNGSSLGSRTPPSRPRGAGSKQSRAARKRNR